MKVKLKDKKYAYVMKSDANRIARRLGGKVVKVKLGRGFLFKVK